MKRMGYITKKIGAGIVLAGFVLLCFSACRRAFSPKNGAREVLKKADERKAAQADMQIGQADIAAQCRVWESRYGTEDRLPVELFSDLQRYVAEGRCMDALADYRQEELLCTAEELAKRCPDYERLVEEHFADWRGEHFLQQDKIYCLEDADGGDCFLLFFLHYAEGDTGFLSTMTLKKEGEEWGLTGNAGGVGGVWDYEIFAREEEGKQVYYLLKTYGSFTWLELSRLSESFHVPLGGWEIGLIETGVKPEVLFLAGGSALTVQVKEYVEEYACFLAWMWQNDKPVWGDEEKAAHDAMREAANTAENGTEQIWTIAFGEGNDKKTVTFRMEEAKDGALLLEAYDGEQGACDELLLSCALCFIQEAGVRRITPAYWGAFDGNGWNVRKTESPAQDEMWERILRERQQRSIAPWQGEAVFSDAVFDLMREEAHKGLYGGQNDLLERYRLDLTEDTEIFWERVFETGEENVFGYYREVEECKWAYRWFGEDGDENFLTCINYRYAKDSIQWWKVTEGRLEEYAYVTEKENPSQIIRCEGRVYCITEAVPAYRGGTVYTDVMEIGDGGSWRTSCFLLWNGSKEEREVTCIPLYEEVGLSFEIKDYVQARYEEAAEACRYDGWMKLLAGTEEGELTTEENRMLDSLSDGRRNAYANCHYFAADVDNDGRVEYGAADLRGWLEVTFYEMENGAFHVIPLEEMLPGRDAAGFLTEAAVLRQLWCEKLGDTTYLFTVEEVAYSPDLFLRVRVLKENAVEDKAVYLLKVNMAEDYREGDLEITPLAEGVG